MNVPAKSKADIAREYGISNITLWRWMKPFIDEMIRTTGYKLKQKILTPAQVEFLYSKFGNP